MAMVVLVRVDDRLVHGQVVATWVPHVRADTIIVASDEAAGSRIRSMAIGSCGYQGLCIVVKPVGEAVSTALGDGFGGSRMILLVGGLSDAMRLYEHGLSFTDLNVGNIHHDAGGRRITPSVTLNADDEGLLDSFDELGVRVDFRSVPTSRPLFSKRRRNG